MSNINTFTERIVAVRTLVRMNNAVFNEVYRNWRASCRIAVTCIERNFHNHHHPRVVLTDRCAAP